jgi:hypothetical protein
MIKNPRYDEILEKLKALSPKQEGQSEEEYQLIIDFTLNKVFDDVSVYVHIPVDVLPEQIDNTIISLCLTAIAENGLLSVINGDGGDVTNVSEGDTSVTFMNPLTAYTTLNSGTTITSNSLVVLNSFRTVAR